MSNALTLHNQHAVTATGSPGGLLLDPDRFEFAQRVANMVANSQLVPQALRGKVADCAIALHMADRLNEDPLVVMQNINIINGRAGWSAQYMIGRANRSGILKGRIGWASEGTGANLKVTASAILADTEEAISATVSMAMAAAEGWTKNAKYNSMPEHMLRLRAATMLIRLYMPEVMLGIPAAEEVEDVAFASGQVAAPPAAAVAPPKPRRQQVAQASAPVAPVTVIDVEPEPITPEPEPATDPEPSADYELVTPDGEVRTWMRGQEQNYVTSFLAEMANAARAGKAALEGLWESNAAGLAAAPEGLIAEVQTEYRRLLAEVSRPAQQQPAAPEPAPAPAMATASTSTKPPKASTTAAPPPPPPAGGDDDLF
ncbi:hypothetical protein GAY29_31125 [Azospirillum brasilense]|uniref:hypothetical protein n=1 Tax=Azospirillum brasilense TaxID=192 RepID=UPI001909A424|nr:hypothetical protein [Azospirillum brasilense]MBK3737420.1 hypothetical protein [Azospirillum brasilense]